MSVHVLSAPRSVREQLAEDVRRGLIGEPRSLPPRYFYDARGSELFEQITRLPEYYLTRAETEILERSAADLVGERTELLELGSGSSRKTRSLLEAMHARGGGRVRYSALDVSEAALRGAEQRLTAAYPWVEVDGYVGDFVADLDRVPRRGRRVVALLGSTIGNLEADERGLFLKTVARALQPDDRFLLGVDLVKDVATLEAAYDDSCGVTAEFNRNVLRVVNRELGARLPVDAFVHVARYDPRRAAIDMFLRATRPVVAEVAGVTVRFEAGDELHTEVSCKFTREQVAGELAEVGLALARWETDGRGRVAVAVADPPRLP